MTTADVAKLQTFWRTVLQDPWTRRVVQASRAPNGAVIMIHERAGYFNRDFINLALIADRVPAFAPALAQTHLSLTQVQELTWSMALAGVTLLSNEGYTPPVKDTGLVIWHNVAFLRSHYDTEHYEPLDTVLTGPQETWVKDGSWVTLLNLGARAEYSPPNTTPRIDTTRLQCETTHPCDLTILLYRKFVTADGQTGMRSVKGAQVCVQGTTNCEFSSNDGPAVLHHLPPGDVTVTIDAGDSTKQILKFPLVYRHQREVEVILPPSK